MSVQFEFEIKKGSSFLTAFADRFNTTIHLDRVFLPAILGEGYIQQVMLDGLAVFIHNYRLRQEFVIRSRASFANHGLRMKFNRSGVSFEYSHQHHDPFYDQGENFEAEIGTCNIGAELRMPADQKINFVIIGISRENLLKMLKLDNTNVPIVEMIKSQPSFVIRETLSPEMNGTLKQLFRIDSSTQMPSLLYEMKAKELIYYLFKSLLRRKIDKPIQISQADAEKIYLVRLELLKDLKHCPRLPDLARNAGLGLTKLKTLFKRVFGTSIYDYFQSLRMIEAANLLNTLSVSEAGYHLGFTNLSHFARLFERHHQIKPKHFKVRLREEKPQLKKKGEAALNFVP